jgi:glycine/D-amino acid oxidase-like deaminating enzyme
VTLYEETPALEIVPGGPGRRPALVTIAGRLRADVVVRAGEAWTPTLQQRRAVVPLYSLMIATEPLPAAVWSEIGLRGRQTFADHRHMVVYGQRTADGRIAFGGRGAPYHFGSRVRAGFDRERRIHAALAGELAELFPVLRGVEITHRWGGPIGVPRDWFSSVGFDASTGLAWAGGYVGDGVATSNLAGRTLADLVLRHDSELVRLPWVGHRSRAWEPEPFRWLGINAALWATTAIDRSEARRGRPSAAAARLERFIGG